VRVRADMKTRSSREPGPPVAGTETGPGRVSRGRLVLATIAAIAVILLAPFVSDMRRSIRSAFPGQFVPIVGTGIALVIGAALVWALVRIRERRALRYGALAAAVAIGAGYSAYFRTGIPDADAVERFHFVEFGLVTLLFYRAYRPVNDLSMFVVPVLAGLIVGTLEEWLQWFIPVRVGEIRDIFLNLAAIVSGLLFSMALDPPPSLPRRLRRGSAVRTAALGAVAAVGIAAFFHTVHLGHEIRAAGDRVFRSRYTADALVRLAAARAEAWRSHPPPLAVPRLSREDQYLTEAIEHVRERNRLWEGGDLPGAWHENRILETYYAPALATPSYHAPAGSRWPDAQRQQAQSAASASDAAGPQGPGGPGVYTSRSNPAPIVTWPPLVLWSAVFAVASAMLVAGWRANRRVA
jgi:hypothetical protein